MSDVVQRSELILPGPAVALAGLLGVELPGLTFDHRLVAVLFDHQGLVVRADHEHDRTLTAARDVTGRRTAEGTLSA